MKEYHEKDPEEMTSENIEKAISELIKFRRKEKEIGQVTPHIFKRLNSLQEERRRRY